MHDLSEVVLALSDTAPHSALLICAPTLMLFASKSKPSALDDIDQISPVIALPSTAIYFLIAMFLIEVYLLLRSTFQYSTTTVKEHERVTGICGANKKAPPKWGL